MQGLVTSWGLVRHWWVLSKLALSLLVLGVLLLQLGGIGAAARAADDAARLVGLTGLRWSFVVHATGGLAVLTLALVLSVVKPKGRTGWGAREGQRASALPTPGPPGPRGPPRARQAR